METPPGEVTGADPGFWKGGGPTQENQERGGSRSYILASEPLKGHRGRKRAGPDPLDAPLNPLLGHLVIVGLLYQKGNSNVNGFVCLSVLFFVFPCQAWTG